jgi:beta-1,4-mannosyl-glycoprotein beta-1,4-N-acetylglucosaminyltransferase
MVIDSFLYYNEVELLELRLKVLYDYVDKFIITEGDHSFKGDPKPFRCKKDLSKLGFGDDPKIHVIEKKLKSCVGETSKDEEKEYWNILRKTQVSLCNNEDILILSDIDELPHPNSINGYVDYINNNPNFLLACCCHNLQYQVNYALTSKLEANSSLSPVPLMAKGEFWKNNNPLNIKYRVSQGGNIEDFEFKFIYAGFIDNIKRGWHLSWMGGTDKHLEKINLHNWNLEGDGYSKILKSNSTKDKIKNFNPKNNTDVLGRNNYKLVEFDHTELFEVIDSVGNLPHIKKYLLNQQND